MTLPTSRPNASALRAGADRSVATNMQRQRSRVGLHILFILGAGRVHSRKIRDRLIDTRNVEPLEQLGKIGCPRKPTVN